MSDTGWKGKGIVLGVLLGVFAVYAPSLGGGFTLDDKLVVEAMRPGGVVNEMVAEIRPLTTYFTSGYWGGDTGRKSELYRPVIVLSYAVTNAWWGASALPHHLINVLLHTWSVLLVFQLLARLSIPRRAALFGAAAFGFDAIHSEVVAGIVGRAELLAFCFGAQALLLLVPFDHSSRGLKFAKRSAGAVLLFLAFCSKESALAWAPFTAVYAIADDLVHRRPLAPVRALTVFAIAVLPALAFGLLRTSAVGDITPVVHYYANPLAHVDTATRVLSAVMIWAFGLLRCVLPLHLLSDYGPVNFELVESTSDPRFLISCIALLALLIGGIAVARRHPLVFLATACFLGFSVVTSNVPFPIGTIFGERLYFAPSLAIGILVAWLVSRTKTRLLLVVLAAWILASSVVILTRNGAWQSDAALFASDIRAGTRSVRVMDQRALQLRDTKEPAEAEALWQRAIELDPMYADALFNFASYLGSIGRYTEAEAFFKRAIAVPDARNGRRHIYRRDLSVLYELTNRRAESTEQLRLAWREDSAFGEVWEPLVERTVNHLSPREIQAIIATGEQRAPGNATWPFLRAILAHRRHESAAAIKGFEHTLDIRPGHAWTRLELARSLLAAGRRAEGGRILRELADDPRTPDRFRRVAARMAR